MTPTPKLRFVERKVAMHPFYKDVGGGTAYQTYHVLQQWWENKSTDVYYPNGNGEWRDVPLEKEQT